MIAKQKFLLWLYFPLLLSSGTLSYSLRVNRSDLSFTKINGYDYLSISGFEHTFIVGKPELPMKNGCPRWVSGLDIVQDGCQVLTFDILRTVEG